MDAQKSTRNQRSLLNKVKSIVQANLSQSCLIKILMNKKKKIIFLNFRWTHYKKLSSYGSRCFSQWSARRWPYSRSTLWKSIRGTTRYDLRKSIEQQLGFVPTTTIIISQQRIVIVSNSDCHQRNNSTAVRLDSLILPTSCSYVRRRRRMRREMRSRSVVATTTVVIVVVVVALAAGQASTTHIYNIWYVYLPGLTPLPTAINAPRETNLKWCFCVRVR